MARSDLLIALVRASMSRDNSVIERTVEAIIAEESAKKHHGVANRLKEALASGAPDSIHDFTKTHKSLNQNGQKFLYEYEPHTEMNDLILPSHIRRDIEELIQEQVRADILRANGLEPRNRILLAGPPGNGKTSLAEAISYQLALPLLLIKYDQLIGSYLGESALQLREVFEYARTQRCVLFFDEFDAIGKGRGDVHETGEIRRLVNSLIMQIDRLPSYTVVIAATNHPELLDRAIWRRFQLRALLPKPSLKEVQSLLNKYFKGYPGVHHQTITALAKKFDGVSLAEIEDFSSNVLRRHVLSLEMKSIKDCIAESFDLWKHRFTLETQKDSSNGEARTTSLTTSNQANSKKNQG